MKVPPWGRVLIRCRAVSDTRLSPYVTNLDRDVFALRNLPEEVVAVLFAYYSRSRDDLRANLLKLLDDRELAMLDTANEAPGLETAQAKARAFHEKWVVGYGHASVAEHAVVHLAVERCSILAAKALEEARLAAYTEKSTRYVRFDEGSLVTDIGLPARQQAIYENSARSSLATYANLVDRAEKELLRRHEMPPGVTLKAHEANLRAHACDLLRPMLPAGVPTNLGITANARVLEHHLGRLAGSPLAEVRRLGRAMKDEASVIVPTLLKYTAASAHRDQAATRVIRAHGALHEATPSPEAFVRLVDHSFDPLRTLAASVQCELFGTDWDAAWQSSLEPRHALEVVRAYLADRGPHDQPLRALEQVTLRFEVCCDYGAWRDLQRHRMVSATTPRLGTSEGFWLSPELDELGLAVGCRHALESAAEAHRVIASTHPWEAQYVVPLAFKVRYVLQCNLREAFHFIELRSARQGHEAYRKVAQAMADELIKVCPWVDGLLRVDRDHYPFARH